MKQPLQIAIDGPVGSGKSDISLRLAKALHIPFLYTGVMYRALALLAKRSGVGWKDRAKIVDLLTHHDIDYGPVRPGNARPYTVTIDGEDVTDTLFSQELDIGASDVGTVPEARAYMVERQKRAAAGRSVIMEGRDIGLRVLPNADLKIYLTADVPERARRRLAQYETRGVKRTFDEVVSDTKARDAQDTTRETDPLQKLPDSWELDTTGKNQEEVVQAIMHELTMRGLL